MHPFHRFATSECGAAWIACLLREQEVTGSNPVTPTTKYKASEVVLFSLFHKHLLRVRMFEGKNGHFWQIYELLRRKILYFQCLILLESLKPLFQKIRILLLYS